MRTGRGVSPSRLDVTVNWSEALSASADETTVTQASAVTASRRALMGMEVPFHSAAEPEAVEVGREHACEVGDVGDLVQAHGAQRPAVAAVERPGPVDRR